jgi:hypothetical protein
VHKWMDGVDEHDRGAEPHPAHHQVAADWPMQPSALTPQPVEAPSEHTTSSSLSTHSNNACGPGSTSHGPAPYVPGHRKSCPNQAPPRAAPGLPSRPTCGPPDHNVASVRVPDFKARRISTTSPPSPSTTGPGRSLTRAGGATP